MQRPTIFVLNGPNLNTLGTRRPEIYGAETLADVEARVRRRADAAGFGIEFFQSNHEGELVEKIQQARRDAVGIVINPAAYTHTSVAIHDALEYAETPTVEVHISNVHAREPFRRHSYVSPLAKAVIAGAGTLGYEFAIEWLADHLRLQHTA
ncbi:type II 3-dehydroquinate dehydratase [Gulosibacter sp. 10]|uniref:type II 3-dehydroquinate dehydratase n=1 Tax=Gulosibacter sp. 10 TaxID=1255570 RepID=UPI00097F2AAE|nr:type II 3-dehydroquinate dehydratase [Gulosibacter sp. 10]SJM57358.1 3-dehydroquinate dehydratase II [Gulosibacter sp. 10]